jgi:hypothetical protein
MLSRGGKILGHFLTGYRVVNLRSSEAHHDPFNTPKHAIETNSYEGMKHGPTQTSPVVRMVLT